MKRLIILIAVLVVWLITSCNKEDNCIGVLTIDKLDTNIYEITFVDGSKIIPDNFELIDYNQCKSNYTK